MEVKKARHEKLVIGSFGSSLIGKPNSSTSGGGGPGSRFLTGDGPRTEELPFTDGRRRGIGGGTASSSSGIDSLSLKFSSSRVSSEWV